MLLCNVKTRGFAETMTVLLTHADFFCILSKTLSCLWAGYRDLGSCGWTTVTSLHVARQASLDNFEAALHDMQASCAPIERALVAGNDCLTVPVASSLCLSKAQDR